MSDRDPTYRYRRSARLSDNEMRVMRNAIARTRVVATGNERTELDIRVELLSQLEVIEADPQPPTWTCLRCGMENPGNLEKCRTKECPTARDHRVWHYSPMPGESQCGRYEPGEALTAVANHVTCVQCRALWINVRAPSFPEPGAHEALAGELREVVAKLNVTLAALRERGVVTQLYVNVGTDKRRLYFNEEATFEIDKITHTVTL